MARDHASGVVLDAVVCTHLSNAGTVNASDRGTNQPSPNCVTVAGAPAPTTRHIPGAAHTLQNAADLCHERQFRSTGPSDGVPRRGHGHMVTTYGHTHVSGVTVISLVVMNTNNNHTSHNTTTAHLLGLRRQES